MKLASTFARVEDVRVIVDGLQFVDRLHLRCCIMIVILSVIQILHGSALADFIHEISTVSLPENWWSQSSALYCIPSRWNYFSYVKGTRRLVPRPTFMKKYQQQIIEVEASKKHRDWSENAWYLSGIWVVVDGILASFFGWNIAPVMEDITKESLSSVPRWKIMKVASTKRVLVATSNQVLIMQCYLVLYCMWCTCLYLFYCLVADLCITLQRVHQIVVPPNINQSSFILMITTPYIIIVAFESHNATHPWTVGAQLADCCYMVHSGATLL